MVEEEQSEIFIERPAQKKIQKRQDEVAIESYGKRQLRIARAVTAILDEKFKHSDFTWEVFDHLFGTPTDTPVIVGDSPNEDGTVSSLIFVGDMEIFAKIFQNLPNQSQKRARKPRERDFNWLDPTLGPLPAIYPHTKLEIEMPLNEKDKEAISKIVSEKMSKSLENQTISIDKISFSPKQLAILISTTIGCSVAIGGGIISAALFVSSSLNQMDRKIDVMNTTIEERLPRSPDQ